MSTPIALTLTADPDYAGEGLPWEAVLTIANVSGAEFRLRGIEPVVYPIGSVFAIGKPTITPWGYRLLAGASITVPFHGVGFNSGDYQLSAKVEGQDKRLYEPVPLDFHIAYVGNANDEGSVLDFPLDSPLVG